jgi:hypothetical protein
LALFSWSASLTQCLQEAAESALYFPTTKQATTKQALGGGCIQNYLSTNQLKLLLLWKTI